MRAAIYSRFSSENQREASIEDQLRECECYCAAQGWTVVRHYADRAISGASAARPAYQEMRRDAEAGAFDVLVVEALDRLSRNLADVAELFNRFEFRGLKLHAIALGPIGALHVGLMGTIAQMYLSDLRDKTRRGQRGRVLQGRIPAGRAYGYAVGPGDATGAGVRTINEAEAAVVRRIFRLFADGISPRAIARRLNGEGVPGPDGRPWGDTTIRGQRDRGTGLLNNPLYAGELVWNRCSYVKDPKSGKRLARPNPPERWERVAVPGLRIVDADLWERVKALQAETSFTVGRDATGTALNRSRRRRFLLSGLLKCSLCGGGYTIMARDRYGCAAHRQKGTCANGTTIDRFEIEGRVLSALKEKLLAPALFEEFARAYAEEVNRRAREALGERARLEGELARADRQVNQIIRSIEDGLYHPAMKERMASLAAQQEGLKAALADLAEPAPARLHPSLPQLYRRKVEELERLLADPELGPEAEAALRGTIRKIVLSPRPEGGLAAEVHGDLAAILALSEAAGKKRNAALEGAASQLSVVAGTRCHLWRTALD